ncbi:MAG TPA: hypothetical protein QGH10_07070 [Armatimonadota bacterium]|nr:hypothetical protein [Armatimonadota bacterium]
MADSRPQLTWHWHLALPAGVGAGVSAVLWASASQYFPGLSLYVIAGGALTGLLMGAILQRSVGERGVGGCAGCAVVALLPLMATFFLVSIGEAPKIPDWLMAGIYGSLIALAPVLAVQVLGFHWRVASDWRTAGAVCGLFAAIWVARVVVGIESNYLGRPVRCISNVKQLSLGLAMYTDDHDGRYPPDRPFSTSVALTP